MDLELSSKHVLITGGSKGIGLACAAAFLAEGARVTLVSRSEAHLQAAQASLRAASKNAIVNIIAADLRDAAAAEQMVDVVERDFGVVDVLVNSAGAAKRTPAAELTAAAWHDAMQAKFFKPDNALLRTVQTDKKATSIATDAHGHADDCAGTWPTRKAVGALPHESPH